MYFFLLYVITIETFSAHGFIGPAPTTTCQTLTQESCRQFYDETRFPNGFKHYTQDEAKREMSHYSIVSANCSDDALILLCLLYFPVCLNNPHEHHVLDSKIVLPCRSLCEGVRAGCEHVVLQEGSSWPERLNCNNLPIYNGEKGEVCVPSIRPKQFYPSTAPPTQSNVSRGGTSRGNTTNATNATNATTQAATVALTVDVLRLQDCVDPLIPSNNSMDSFAGLPNCRAPCTSFYSNDQLKFVSRWILGWSIVCLAAVIACFIVFFTNKKKFADVERPVIYLTGSYGVIALAYIVGFSLERTSISCTGTWDGMNSLNQTAQRTEDWNGACVVTFLMTYWSLMAATSWWIILTVFWCLSACKIWNDSIFSEFFYCIQVVAWSSPTILVAVAVGLKGFDGDVLSNTCSPGNSNLNFLVGLVVAPLFIYLILGSVFLVTGLVAAGRSSKLSIGKRKKVNHAVQMQNAESSSQHRLVGQRSSMGSDSNSRTDSGTEDKKGVFPAAAASYGLLYLFIVALLLSCAMYERDNRLTWEKSLANCLVEEEGCDSRSGPSVEIFALKYFVMLMVGVMTLLWMWCSKWSYKDFKPFIFGWTTKHCVKNCQGPPKDTVTVSNSTYTIEATAV